MVQNMIVAGLLLEATNLLPPLFSGVYQCNVCNALFKTIEPIELKVSFDSKLTINVLDIKLLLLKKSKSC